MIAGVDQGGDGEAAAGGFSREGDAGRGGAVCQEGLVGGQGVVDRGRVRVLGGEPVVDGDDLGAGPPGDLRGQAGGLEGVPQDVYAAVEVQDNVAGLGSVDGDLGGGDAAQRGGGHGDLGGQRLRGEQLRSSRRCSLRSMPAGKADCRKIASRFSRCSVLTQDLPSVGAWLGSAPRRACPCRSAAEIPCREAGHYQACRQAGEQASPDHGDSCDRTRAPKVLMVLTPGARGLEQEQGAPERAGRALGHGPWERPS